MYKKLSFKVIAVIQEEYILWCGLFIAFTAHLAIHCFQTFILRKYVPAIITSVICLPACMFIIKYIIQLFLMDDVILYSIFGFIIMVVNLVIIIRCIFINHKII